MSNLAANSIDYLLRVVFATFGQLFILLGPGMLLALCMQLLSDGVCKLACRIMGPQMYLALFGMLGTVVHEIGHIVFALLFLHRVVATKLFEFNLNTPLRGYIVTAFNRHSIYQQIGRFFIGVGPILIGTLTIYAAFRLLLAPEGLDRAAYGSLNDPFASPVENLAAVLAETFELARATLAELVQPSNLLNWRFYLFLYLAFSIGSSMTLSAPDIESVLVGLRWLVSLVFCVNLGTLWLGGFADTLALSISRFYGFFYAIMLFVIVLNLVVVGGLAVVGRR